MAIQPQQQENPVGPFTREANQYGIQYATLCNWMLKNAELVTGLNPKKNQDGYLDDNTLSECRVLADQVLHILGLEAK